MTEVFVEVVLVLAAILALALYRGAARGVPDDPWWDGPEAWSGDDGPIEDPATGRE